MCSCTKPRLKRGVAAALLHRSIGDGGDHADEGARGAGARRGLVRFRSLAKQDFASRQQVDTQQALVSQFVAAIAGDDAAIEAAQLNLNYCSITSPVDGRVGLRLVDAGNLIHAT